MPLPDDLQRYGEALAGKAARYTRGRLPGQVKGEGAIQAIEHGGGRFALDGVWSTLDRPRSQGHLRRQEQVVALAEAPRLLVEHRACQLCLAVLHRGNAPSGVDHLGEAGLKPLGPLVIAFAKTRRIGDIPHERRQFAWVVPTGVHRFDLTPEGLKTFRRSGSQTPHLGINRGIAKIDAQGHAPAAQRFERTGDSGDIVLWRAINRRWVTRIWSSHRPEEQGSISHRARDRTVVRAGGPDVGVGPVWHAAK